KKHFRAQQVAAFLELSHALVPVVGGTAKRLSRYPAGGQRHPGPDGNFESMRLVGGVLNRPWLGRSGRTAVHDSGSAAGFFADFTLAPGTASTGTCFHRDRSYRACTGS